MTSQERRRSSRSLQRFLVRFEDAGEHRMAFTENISTRGLFLKTRYPPPPGVDVRLMIRTPQGTKVRRGVVMWSRYNLAYPSTPMIGSGAGIRFALEPTHNAEA